VDGTRDRLLRRAALATFGTVVALVVAALALDGGHRVEALDRGLVTSGGVYAATGLLLSWARPRNPLGWLLSLTALVGAVNNAGQAYGARALLVGDLDLPAAALVTSWTAPLWIPALTLPATVLLVRYPTGGLPSGWGRRFHHGVVAGLLLLCAGYAGTAESVTDIAPGHLPPVVLPEPVVIGLVVVGAALFLPCALAVVVHAVVRLLRAQRPERQQLALLLTTAVVAAAVVVVDPVPHAGGIAYVCIPFAVVIGVLRYDLLGVEQVVRRTLLYGCLTGLVLGAFVAVTAALTAVLPRGRTPEVVAASLVAIGLGPARERLQRLVDRLVHGDRGDAWAALHRLGTPLGGSADDDLLEGVTAALAEALRVPAVAVARPDGSVVAGRPGDDAVRVPLVLGGRVRGALLVPPRPGDTWLAAADRRLVEAVAPVVAVALRAVELTEALRAERARVVEVASAERERLRRDLHDGLGPSLTGVGLGLEALERRSGADDLTARLRAEVAGAVEEIRRILDDLRPAGLDETGLVEALRRRGRGLEAAGVEVRVSGPDGALDLDPEVEAAAYRIADEALSNVARHARATRCEVEVSLNGALRLRVRDDGTGIPRQREGGVGLPSMRARAERLGGRFEAAQDGGGTTVAVELPAAAGSAR
jgi:signal transduction histidine kinase